MIPPTLAVAAKWFSILTLLNPVAEKKPVAG